MASRQKKPDAGRLIIKSLHNMVGTIASMQLGDRATSDVYGLRRKVTFLAKPPQLLESSAQFGPFGAQNSACSREP